MAEKLFHVGVKGLIKNAKGEILLLKADVSKHSKNTEVYWDIPGGRIKEGQTALETLAREVEEETGIQSVLSPNFFTAVISNHEIPLNEVMLGLVLMVYEVDVPEGAAIRLSGEHTEFGWFPPREAAKLLRQKYPEEFTALL